MTENGSKCIRGQPPDCVHALLAKNTPDQKRKSECSIGNSGLLNADLAGISPLYLLYARHRRQNTVVWHLVGDGCDTAVKPQPEPIAKM